MPKRKTGLLVALPDQSQAKSVISTADYVINTANYVISTVDYVISTADYKKGSSIARSNLGQTDFSQGHFYFYALHSMGAS